MKLVCARDELSRGLQVVLRSVGTRAGIPALAGVLMELGEEHLVLTTTDLELTTRVTLGVSGERGQVLLPARLLAEVVRSLPGEDVELVREDGTMRVSAGRARFGLRFLPAEDFPRVDPSGEWRDLEVEGAVFSRALAQVVVAASRDETRPVLTGVLFEGEGDELRVVATDSYRLAVRRLEVGGADGVRLLVPARAVQEAARLVGEQQVRLRVGGSHVAIEAGNVTVQSRLIEGEFPAYRQLLPQGLENVLEVQRGGFVESLRRVGVLAHDATPVFLELDEGGVRLTCTSQGLGEAAEEVEGSYRGQSMRVAFNPSYLENGVEGVEEEGVRIELQDPGRPALIRGATSDAYQYLLMPIRVS